LCGWSDDDGVNRSKSFPTKVAAKAYDREQREATRRSREAEAIRDALQKARALDAEQLRSAVRGMRAMANANWDEVGTDDLYVMRLQNRIADALEKRAEAIEQGKSVAGDYIGPSASSRPTSSTTTLPWDARRSSWRCACPTSWAEASGGFTTILRHHRRGGGVPA
jgi:hypothetical protein